MKCFDRRVESGGGRSSYALSEEMKVVGVDASIKHAHWGVYIGDMRAVNYLDIHSEYGFGTTRIVKKMSVKEQMKTHTHM